MRSITNASRTSVLSLDLACRWSRRRCRLTAGLETEIAACLGYAQGRRSQYEGRSRRDGSNRVYACCGSVVSSSALAP
jgi:hypothetical protein